MTQLIPRWFPDASIRSCDKVASGFSGAIVWKLRLEDEPSFAVPGLHDWAIRCWPAETSLERVLEIHSVIRHARQLQCGFLPQYRPCQRSGLTAFENQQRVWECSQWMPGAPPNLVRSVKSVAPQLGFALAQFHNATASMGRQFSKSALVIDSRLHRLRTLEKISNQGSFAPAAMKSDVKLHWASNILQQHWTTKVTTAKTVLNELQAISWHQQYVLRDVHCQNTLFDNEQLTAILDYDALRIDSPAADIARLIGSMQLGLTEELWQGVSEIFSEAATETKTEGYKELVWQSLLAAYRQIRAFSEQEERLARLLVEVSPVVNLANWVVWLAQEPARFQGRMEEAIVRMCDWARVVQGDCSDRGPS